MQEFVKLMSPRIICHPAARLEKMKVHPWLFTRYEHVVMTWYFLKISERIVSLFWLLPELYEPSKA